MWNFFLAIKILSSKIIAAGMEIDNTNGIIISCYSFIQLQVHGQRKFFNLLYVFKKL